MRRWIWCLMAAALLAGCTARRPAAAPPDLWPVAFDGAILGVAPAESYLFVLTEDVNGRTLRKLDLTGAVIWKQQVQEKYLLVASRNGRRVLLRDEQWRWAYVRDGETGEVIGKVLDGWPTTVSDDGKTILSSFEMSLNFWVFDENATPLWEKKSPGGVFGDMATETGHIVYWSMQDVELLDSQGQILWGWRPPRDAPNIVQITSDARFLLVVTTPNFPPAPPGMNETYVLDGTGKLLASRTLDSANLIADGRLVHETADAIIVDNPDGTDATRLTRPRGCPLQGVTTQVSGLWILATCKVGEYGRGPGRRRLRMCSWTHGAVPSGSPTAPACTGTSRRTRGENA